MKRLTLEAGDVTLRPLLWKEHKEITSLAEIHSGLMKNSIYFEEAEYRMVDKEKSWVDNLSKKDGEKLRLSVKELLDSGDSKN